MRKFRSVFHLLVSLAVSFNYAVGNSEFQVVSTGEKIHICDDELLRVFCSNDSSSVLVFEEANYGRLDRSVVCQNADPRRITDAICRMPCATGKMNEQCFGRPTCDFSVNADVLGDPCPSVSKYLEASYRCIAASQIIRMCSTRHQKLDGIKEGYIVSPDYPGLYEPDWDCLVTIQAPPGYRYDVTVLDLSVEPRKAEYGCMDRLTVQDETVVYKTHNYCGDTCFIHTDSPLKVNQIKKLKVSFFSNPINKLFRGFLIKFTEVEEISEEL